MSAASSSSSVQDERQARPIDNASDHDSDSVPPVVQSERRLACLIHDKLAVGEDQALAVKSHKSAVAHMCALRDVLIKSNGASTRDTQMLLLFSGISCQRRLILGSEGHEIEDLNVTLALLLVLQVLCKPRDQKAGRPPTPDGTPDETPDETPESTETPEPTATDDAMRDPPSCNDTLQTPPTAAPMEVEADQAEQPMEPPPGAAPSEAPLDPIEAWSKQTLYERMSNAVPEDDVSWSAVLRATPQRVARACLESGATLGAEGSLKAFVDLGHTFFRASALSLQYDLLNQSREETNFLTLGAVDFVTRASGDRRKERLSAIADAAESESGQQILRDLVLSFTLPQSVVGTRRTPLLSREANTIATEHHAVTLGEAHDAAMRGAEWSWKSDENPIHQMAALLAGVCLLLLGGKGGSANDVRKSDAFSGRVSLPFLETPTPLPGVKRMALIPDTNVWIVYSIDKRQQLHIHLRQNGFEGMCDAVLMLAASI